MALPFFHTEDLRNDNIILNEETSKHITQVLRMKVGDEIMLTDGKGTKANASIINDHRKKCEVKIVSIEVEKENTRKVAIGISLIKSSSRFEWFLEKATEIGVSEIIPLICERTEKHNFRHDRMKNILVSAMLQSQQTWLPILNEPLNFDKLMMLQLQQYKNKFIAHCIDSKKLTLSTANNQHTSLMLIGPEGDFTPKEIQAAVNKNFFEVSLGKTRLRTETAGLVAAVLLQQ
jgi:16S rRNA (uracil1498-N3)-methyltransferase